MSVYDELDFAPMLISDLFTLHRGRVCQRDTAGVVPYIGAAARNNSLVGFVKEKAMFPGGWLAIVNNGDGGAGYCTYQPAAFSGSADVTALEPLVRISPEGLVVLASAITHQCFAKYSFGYKPNMQRLAKQRIMVPVTRDSAGEQVVDWEGMTRFGRELLDEATSRTEAAREVDAAVAALPLPGLRFEPMLITDVFESMGASAAWYDKNKVKPGIGPFPYISRSGMSNGYESSIRSQDVPPNLGNAITVGVDTQTIFYQPVDFYTSVKIQVLRHPMMNVDSGLLLVSLLRQQMGKFQWGNGASLARLAVTHIMVPVTIDSATGTQAVDWEGMEQYGRVLRSRAEQELVTATDKLGA